MTKLEKLQKRVDALEIRDIKLFRTGPVTEESLIEILNSHFDGESTKCGMLHDSPNSITLTMTELLNIVSFAAANGDTEFKTVSITTTEDSGIGQGVEVSSSTGTKDVTNYDCW
jgi:hypothetical protein